VNKQRGAVQYQVCLKWFKSRGGLTFISETYWLELDFANFPIRTSMATFSRLPTGQEWCTYTCGYMLLCEYRCMCALVHVHE